LTEHEAPQTEVEAEQNQTEAEAEQNQTVEEFNATVGLVAYEDYYLNTTEYNETYGCDFNGFNYTEYAGESDYYFNNTDDYNYTNATDVDAQCNEDEVRAVSFFGAEVVEEESSNSTLIAVLIASVVAAFAGFLYLKNKKGDSGDFKKINSTTCISFTKIFKEDVETSQVDGYERV
jgi:hypothetical protein